MRKLGYVPAAALTIAVLCTMHPASAAPVTLPAPPAAGNATASTLRDAFNAVARAQANNAAAAESAAFSYNAAVELYKAHEYSQARASAISAMSEAGYAPELPPPAHAPIERPAFPGPRYYYIIPDEVPATPANAKRYVTLAHNAMANCTSATATSEYKTALSALGAKNYRAAMAGARNVVDDCAGQ